MHGKAQRDAALILIAAGVNDCEISRRLGIPRTTIRDWRRPSYERRSSPAICPRCWRATKPVQFLPSDYAELLGLYLGDGHITSVPRTQRLRLSLDSRYTRVISEAGELLRRCFPRNRVGCVHADRGATAVLYVYYRHLSCLFPQHGPGKKHDRRIVLEPWQSAVIERAPWAFIRGCFRSDGCAYVNRTGRYEYLSYCFDNLSADIRRLFIDACGLVGVECRSSRNSVRIYRRASVALMLEHVGTKG